MLNGHGTNGCQLVILQDLDVFQLIKWEAVIVDDFQCSRMYSHFENFKSLSTQMRLLFVNGQLKVCFGWDL